MSAKNLDDACRRIARHAGAPIDVAVVLGSGLGDAIDAAVEGVDIAYRHLHVPATSVSGHRGVARVGRWAGKSVVAFAGRPHLYESHSARAVTYLVRLAARCGAKTIVLTNAAGAVNPRFRRGDVMVIADHLNLTGASPLDGTTKQAFVDMTDAYAPHLRKLALASDGDAREGVYAGVRGPNYETAAEVEALHRIGADAVGMSTVLETIAARALGLEVLGLSLITNARGSDTIAHDDVLAASAAGAARIVATIGSVFERS